MAILYIMLLCDSIIAGFFIGENGVAAINAITPVTNIITFFANIVTVGTGILYSRAIGAMDKKRADALFGQGLILNAAIALCCSAALLLGKDLYFAANGVTGEIYALASDYYRWTPLCALFAVFNAYIGQMVYTDGDETCTNISYVFQIVGNVALSIALVRRLGMQGIILGAMLGNALGLAVSLAHFLRKRNTLRFTWHVSLGDLRQAVKFSAVDTAI